MCLFLLIYLITYLTSIDSWILFCTGYFSSNPVLLYFVIQIGHGSSFSWLLCPYPYHWGHFVWGFLVYFSVCFFVFKSFITYHCGAFSFSISLLPGSTRCFCSTRCSRLILFMSCPRSRTSHFSKESSSCHWRMVLESTIWVLGVPDAVGVPINLNWKY